MAVDFTYVSGTDIGRIRFRLSDTSPERFAFTDTEIQSALTDAGSVDGAMPDLLQALLMDRSRRALTYTRTEAGADDDDRTAVDGIRAMLDLYTTGAKASRTIRVTSMGRGPSDPRVR